MTVGITLCAVVVLALTYWQVHEQGRMAWLFGHEKKQQRSTSDLEENSVKRELLAQGTEDSGSY
jgi:type IV secretory pathway TrbD component